MNSRPNLDAPYQNLVKDPVQRKVFGENWPPVNAQIAKKLLKNAKTHEI